MGLPNQPNIQAEQLLPSLQPASSQPPGSSTTGLTFDDHDQIIAREKARLKELDKMLGAGKTSGGAHKDDGLMGRNEGENDQQEASFGDGEEEMTIPVQLWIDWYLSIPGNEFLVAVTMQFLID